MVRRQSRLRARFAQCQQARRKALVAYLVAGDPNYASSLALLRALAAAHLIDVLEIGVPFSDPMAEGAAIQKGHARALAAGVGPAQTLELVRALRADAATLPIVLMGYANILLAGSAGSDDSFLNRAASAGADAVLVVDAPSEEGAAATAHIGASGLDCVKLVAPTTSAPRMHTLVRQATGFVYYVTYRGVTGGTARVGTELVSDLAHLRDVASDYACPVVAGFGIKDAASARHIAPHCAGVAVGSALVSLCGENKQDEVVALLRDIRTAL